MSSTRLIRTAFVRYFTTAAPISTPSLASAPVRFFFAAHVALSLYALAPAFARLSIA
jgi:hypothetical protein